jgi:glycosyltransferase involved in cell wall biosynthesis
LGNVIIEAGFLKCPVIASNVDGIPEIISNNESGILLSPKIPLRKLDLPPDAIPYPEFVIDGVTKKLVKPQELDLDELQSVVESLISNRLKRKNLSEKLFQKVSVNFSLLQYFQKLETLYKSF